MVRMHNDPKGGRSTRKAASTTGSASASGDDRARGRTRPFMEATNLLTDPARTKKHDPASAVKLRQRTRKSDRCPSSAN